MRDKLKESFWPKEFTIIVSSSSNVYDYNIIFDELLSNSNNLLSKKMK